MRDYCSRLMVCVLWILALLLWLPPSMICGTRGVMVSSAFLVRKNRFQMPAVMYPSRRSQSCIGWQLSSTDSFTLRSSSSQSRTEPELRLNLSTVTKDELQTLLVDSWQYPSFRVKQVWSWIRDHGVTDVQKMTNLPNTLQQQLLSCTKPHALELAMEQISKDGTIKRAYRLHDGQLIESVLMPYQDGRYTACISSQAGCAQG
jgi:hypothetical protein